MSKKVTQDLNFLIPTGIILPYAGKVMNWNDTQGKEPEEHDDPDWYGVPEGWLLCDGRNDLRIDKYPDLYNVLKDYWGKIKPEDFFVLPDLRGQFLRGVNHGGKTDPDTETRIAKYGGNTGDQVGSYQGDTFKDHKHSYNTKRIDFNRGSSGGDASVWYQNKTTSSGFANKGAGSETRPKNVYVNYIIKT